MNCYPLGIAAMIAISCDCIRRGDLAGAAASMKLAADLAGPDHGRLGPFLFGPGARGGASEGAYQTPEGTK